MELSPQQPASGTPVATVIPPVAPVITAVLAPVTAIIAPLIPSLVTPAD